MAITGLRPAVLHVHAHAAPYVPHGAAASAPFVLKYEPAYESPAAMLLHLGAVLGVVPVATLVGHPNAPANIAHSAAVAISLHPAAAHVPEYTVLGSSGLPAGHMHTQLAPYVPHAAVAPPWFVLKYVPAYDCPAGMLLHLGAELVVVSVATLVPHPKALAASAHSAAVVTS